MHLEHEPPTYVFHCGSCARRAIDLRDAPVEVFLASISTNRAADESSIGRGYMPAAYLVFAGISVSNLESAARHHDLPVWEVDP